MHRARVMNIRVANRFPGDELVGDVGQHLEWDAEIVNDIPDKLIAWKTVGHADVHHAGSVHFRSLENGGTRVRVEMDYEPPGGAAGAFIARLLGRDASARVEE